MESPFFAVSWDPSDLSKELNFGVILALQACTPVFMEVAIQNVVNHLGNLLSGRWKGRPFTLVKDGDLSQNVTDILRVREQRTVQVCKVNGHATEDMVARGRVRQADLEGNNRADETGDLWQKKAR